MSIVSRGNAAQALIGTNPSSTFFTVETTDFGANNDQIYGNSPVQFSIQQNTSGARSASTKITKFNAQDNYTYTFTSNGSPSSGGSVPNLIITQQSNLNCVDPNVLILMKTGEQKKASEIKVGDVIRSKHELSKELLEDIIIKATSASGHEKLKLIFDDNTDLITSLKHRVYLDKVDDFVAVDSLEVGDIVSGKVIEFIEEYENGTVIEITTEKTHTYISNGVLSHNGK